MPPYQAPPSFVRITQLIGLALVTQGHPLLDKLLIVFCKWNLSTIHFITVEKLLSKYRFHMCICRQKKIMFSKEYTGIDTNPFWNEHVLPPASLYISTCVTLNIAFSCLADISKTISRMQKLYRIKFVILLTSFPMNLFLDF